MVRAVCIFDIDIEEARKWLPLTGIRNHHQRIAYSNLSGAVGRHLADCAKDRAKKLNLSYDVVNDNPRRHGVESIGNLVHGSIIPCRSGRSGVEYGPRSTARGCHCWFTVGPEACHVNQRSRCLASSRIAGMRPMPLIHQPGVGRSEAARTGSNLRPSMPGARTSLLGDEVHHGPVRAHLSRQASTHAGPRFSAYSYNLLGVWRRTTTDPGFGRESVASGDLRTRQPNILGWTAQVDGRSASLRPDRPTLQAVSYLPWYESVSGRYP